MTDLSYHTPNFNGEPVKRYHRYQPDCGLAGYPLSFCILFSVFCLLLFSCLHLGCKKPTEPPPPPDNGKPDTTSHNWVFDQPVLLGGAQSSTLNDVAIINDTLAYAVGEIYLKDANGQIDPLLYNLARWNGNTWSIQRVPYFYQGEAFYNPIQAIFAFSANDIWFAGNGVIRWTGQQYVPMAIPSNVWGSYRVKEIWGTSSTNLYIVGEAGSIAHYSNSVWQKLESGTELNFYDIWGDYDKKTGEWEVLAVASNYDVFPGDKVIVRIRNNTVTNVSTSGTSDYLNSIWFRAGEKYYVCGDGLYERSTLDSCGTGICWEQKTKGYPQLGSIRGNGVNDVMVVGALQFAAHFNGVGWQRFDVGAHINRSVAIRNNTVVIVGLNADYTASITVGKRY